ncbi:MAG: GtrA family protein [Deltaproteobacteria bacterium]|nr:GtrA family protein [Deltaproteobacteria bacterium]
MRFALRCWNAWTSVWTFAKSALTGAIATLVDFAILLFLVEILHVAPALANVPALIGGAVAQFVGNRHFAFAARGAQRADWRRQAVLFVLAEGLTLALNALAFHVLAIWLRVPYALARPVGTFVVFACVSYPIWRWVFRPPSSSATTS